jgi:beta-aspartyl-peptidase (threonine type)
MKKFVGLLLPLTLVACSSSTPKESSSSLPVQGSVSPLGGSRNCKASNKFTLVIHGGVGYEPSTQQTEVISRILKEGHDLLKSGARGLDVVQHVVEVMEDSGIFNTGRGGTRTSANTVELDASLMDGRDLSAGAVASLKDVKNPIRLARAVKEQTKHVFMVGPGASQFARQSGFEMVGPEYFTSEPYKVSVTNEKPKDFHYGTVGAATLDRCGDLAAATSTGGLYGKMPGRVGDSPVIGAGMYANNNTVALSATGEGEKFIRANVGVRVSSIMEYTRRPLKSAVNEALGMVQKMNGTGGIIAVDRKGHVVWNTINHEPMPRGYVNQTGKVVQPDMGRF